MPSFFLRDSLNSFFSNVHQNPYKSYLSNIPKPGLQPKNHSGIALTQRVSQCSQQQATKTETVLTLCYNRNNKTDQFNTKIRYE